MTIWILAILLVASLAALGLRQGAIRVAFSFLGIIVGAMLAAPLGGLIKPLLSAVGVKNPLLLWLLPPCIIFLIVLTLFKSAGLIVHRKVEVFYKYQAGDLRLALWERLNHRVGLCLGIANGVAYFILVALVIYMMSYWTYQMATADSDPWIVRVINQLGKDVQSTGMSKVARAVDRSSPAFYDAADVIGLIYHNETLQPRLARYPGLLGLIERPEFQDLATDKELAGLRQKQAPIFDLINYPKMQAILKNGDMMKNVDTALVPNLQDLRHFLETGRSTNFTEKILGRWDFDINGAIALLTKAKPNLPVKQKNETRRWMYTAFAKTIFIATPEQQVFLKNVPPTALGMTSNEPQTLSGQWKESGSRYELTFTVNGKSEQMIAEITGERLGIPREPVPFSFIPEQ
jgi:Colicin V production protein